MEVKMEEEEIKVPKYELVCVEVSKNCRCDELEERSKKAEARIVELQLEIENKNSECEVLEAKCKKLEADIETFRKRSNEVREQGNFVEGDEEDIVEQLMVENRVLECEKRKAENEAVVWKEQFKELEQSQVDGSTTSRGRKRLLSDIINDENRPDIKHTQVHKKSSMVGLGDTGRIPDKGIDNSPSSGTPNSHTSLLRKDVFSSKLEEKYPRKSRRHLSFDEERSPCKKIAPATPGNRKPARVDVIDIFDSDDESDTQDAPLSDQNELGNKEVSVSADHVLLGTLDGKTDEICCQDYEEDIDECKENISCIPTSKRKRAAKIVTSDTESDEDDNIPISKLKKVDIQESISPISGNAKGPVTRSRRRLATLRQHEEKVVFENPTTDDVNDEESEPSESERESLGSFIVDSSDATDASDAESVPSQSENESDDNVDYREIMSRIQRSKGKKFKWELEGDMLSAFGKDLELCMRAVCALYRQQTSDEQVSKETKYENNRGFSKFDASRGTELAEFLTEGDPQGDLKKSEQQLKERGSGSVELCRTLATRYSKQLFQIYQNNEDPLFLPS